MAAARASCKTPNCPLIASFPAAGCPRPAKGHLRCALQPVECPFGPPRRCRVNSFLTVVDYAKRFATKRWRFSPCTLSVTAAALSASIQSSPPELAVYEMRPSMTQTHYCSANISAAPPTISDLDLIESPLRHALQVNCVSSPL
uniref:Uncharacterized protein n=1 Tax=Plectus sambesii TaxID=2011161 RepID=A0A914X4S2_9BILA